MFARKSCFVSMVSLTVLLLSRSATALEVERVDAHRGESPPGNSYSPMPVTHSDIVQFSLNTDGKTYSNSCFQGEKSIQVNEETKTVDVEMKIPGPGVACILIFDPVTGVEGEVGPLGSGHWTIQDAFGNSVAFDVINSGDFDGNGVVNVADVDLISSAIRQHPTDLGFDLDGSGRVDLDDLTDLIHEIVGTYFGDANLDGEFDSRDLVQVFQAGHYEDSLPRNSSWETGDWNADGDFGSSDLVLAFQDGGFEQGPRAASTVPEPASGVLLMISLVLLGSHFRR